MHFAANSNFFFIVEWHVCVATEWLGVVNEGIVGRNGAACMTYTTLIIESFLVDSATIQQLA